MIKIGPSILFILFCIALASPKAAFAQTDRSNTRSADSTDWFCDERWSAANIILVGRIEEIIPLEALRRTKREELKTHLSEFTVKNLLRVEIEKGYKNPGKNTVTEIVNLRTLETSAIDFKAGEKYLFYLESKFARKGGLKPTASVPILYFTRPNGGTRPFSEAAGTIDFLERNHQRNFIEEVFGVKEKEVILNGVISGRAIALTKPKYPEEAKKNKLRGRVQVMILADESGQVVKAKAVCPVHPAFVKVAEEAALMSKFSPLLLRGKAVRFTGVIVYNFVP